MDSTKVIKLIRECSSRGSFGQEIITELERTVFGMVRPITRAEWSTAGQRGFQASFRIDVYTFEYCGETVVEVDGVRYGVYRQFVNVGNDKTELYLESKSGITYSSYDVDEEDSDDYIKVYEALSSSGITTFYGNANGCTRLPFIIYEMNSNNFAADNKVFSKGYDLTIELYTPRKDIKRERLLEEALESADIYWEREESDEMDERMYVQRYSAQVR